MLEEKTKSKKKAISQNDIMKLLDACYEKCLDGIPKVSPSVADMAADYLSKHTSKEEACKAMLRSDHKMHHFRSAERVGRRCQYAHCNSGKYW